MHEVPLLLIGSEEKVLFPFYFAYEEKKLFKFIHPKTLNKYALDYCQKNGKEKGNKPSKARK